jgi:Uma2 family endonuclease
MPAEESRESLERRYEEAAERYARKLRMEPSGETVSQATQRRITLESMDLVHAQRPDVQTFNELLVQYRLRGRKTPGQVLPDTMVIVYPQPIQAAGSYDVPQQPIRPFWVLDYVVEDDLRKDYEDNLIKCEDELKVPYYLLFQPESQEMTLYRHTGKKYRAVPPNEQGRCAIPELELEVGILGGWVRYWFRGELLPLPADLLRQLQEKDRQLQEAQAEVARLRAELDRVRKAAQPE